MRAPHNETEKNYAVILRVVPGTAPGFVFDALTQIFNLSHTDAKALAITECVMGQGVACIDLTKDDALAKTAAIHAFAAANNVQMTGHPALAPAQPALPPRPAATLH